IKGVREKERIKELILGAIAEVSLPTVPLGNIIFTFPERSPDQDRTKIRLIKDLRSGEEIGAEKEKEVRTAIYLALITLQDIKEVDVTFRDFDAAFDDYC
ncbi:MAG: hypothetical protein PHE52_01170, partial [Candidatus Pacebacteria bacterium]|nr:hypothetical protein [Candidatus Paceibacterota bacterium]